MRNNIRVVGARVHNLRDVTIDIPKGVLTVVTGVSGSGKSSLVFGTIAAEAQRQFGETLPAFVRNRMPHASRPDADEVSGLAATVVVDQRRLGTNARSTVGTATDIAPLLRLLYSRVATPHVGWSMAFSFNDPQGMCPRCSGLGRVADIDEEKLIDRDLSLDEGAIRFPTFAPGTVYWKRYMTSGLFDPAKPLRAYTDEEWHTLLHGDGFAPPNPLPGWPPSSTYQGVLPRLRRLYLERSTESAPAKVAAALDHLVVRRRCPECGGSRLNAAARGATIDGLSITDCAAMEAGDLADAIRKIDGPVAAPMVAAIAERLDTLVAVGLGYLCLDRDTPSLSGGEAQRVKLVRHLGSSLTDLLYVFDEPTAGLHPHDVGRLIALLQRLRDNGNTVIVVEHDAAVAAAADHVVDIGPGAGARGGRVLYAGPPDGLRRADTPTGRALARPRTVNAEPRPGRATIEVTGSLHNLRDVRVALPREALTVVTGVAGAGKSSIATGLLPRCAPGVVVLDQSPLAGGSRSSVATVTGMHAEIRAAFARASGAPESLFSTNSAGACPECHGRGEIRTDLAFLDDVRTPCEACGATGFAPEALRHRLDGRTIADVLALSVDDAGEVFDLPALPRLHAVGLGYLALGRPASTLSGGERQRLRLAARVDPEPGTVLVLDEPTVGLHMTDVERLNGVFDRMVDGGVTLVVVEHDLDVVARADWVIDVGPGPGHDGGRVLYAGPPAGLVEEPESVTGRHLRTETANAVMPDPWVHGSG